MGALSDFLPKSGLTLISTQTVSSAVAAVDFTGIDSTYDEYELHGIYVTPDTDAVDITLRTSSDGGASFDSGASDYEYSLVYSASGTTTASAISSAASDGIVFSGSVGSETNEDGPCFSIKVFSPFESKYTTLQISSTTRLSNGTIRSFFGGGQRKSAAAVDAVRFLFASGNIESGVFKLYGVRK